MCMHAVGGHAPLHALHVKTCAFSIAQNTHMHEHALFTCSNEIAFTRSPSHSYANGCKQHSLHGHGMHSCQFANASRTIAEAPGCERELTRQGAYLRPVPRITCPPPCELIRSQHDRRAHMCMSKTHATHTHIRLHSLTCKANEICSDDVGQHA